MKLLILKVKIVGNRAGRNQIVRTLSWVCLAFESANKPEERLVAGSGADWSTTVF